MRRRLRHEALPRPWCALTMAIVLCAGCQTLSSVGLPTVIGQYELTEAASRISQSHGRAVELPRELNQETLAAYIVEPGDVLYLEPATFDSPIRLPGDQTVQPDGSVELGKYGRIHASGMTVAEIEREINAAVAAQESDKDGLKPEALQVVVRLVDWKSKVFYVMGEVNAPGSFPFTGKETVLDAIVAAGDITRRANRHEIIISRPTGPCEQRIVLPVCYDNVIQLGDASTNYQLMPGDRVFVPSINLCDDLFHSLLPHLAVYRCPRCGPAQRGQRLPAVRCDNGICEPSSE